jgi:hypothetical protein
VWEAIFVLYDRKAYDAYAEAMKALAGRAAGEG